MPIVSHSLLPGIPWNGLTLLLLAIILFSAIQGARRGATGSALQLVSMLADGALTLLSLYGAWQISKLLSPALHNWLVHRQIRIPDHELSFFMQLYYTMVTGLRDFGLMRSGAIILVSYGMLKLLLTAMLLPLVEKLGWFSPGGREAADASSARSYWTSAPTGALIGGVTGTARALLVVAGVLVYTSLFPDSSFTSYANQSALYLKGAHQVLEPIAGGALEKLPVMTRAVQDEYRNILQRKYEVLDAQVPDDIEQAALAITKDKKTEEEKAKALYHYVGTRIQYDWEKVRLYEEEGIWKEQTPEDTFRTKEGVCIDYSRLYAMMARTVGLQVKVVTGTGYDGSGGSGPHAWNEVFLSAQNRWVPLDSTWASSGGNWFDPPGFDKTHVKEV